MARIGFILLCTFFTFCMSCNSSRIVKTWKDPETQVSLEKLNKILVAAFLRDETNRRAVGGKGQPAEKGVEAFALKLSVHVGKEIGGA